MVEPSERLLWLVVLVAAMGALGLGVPVLGEAAPFLAVGVLLSAFADAALAGSPRHVRVRRVLPEHIVEGRPAPLALAFVAPRPFLLDVIDTLPAGALPAGADACVRHVVRLGPGEHLTTTTHAVFVRRGTHLLGRVALRARGPLGLVRRRARVPLAAPVEVVPDLARIAARAERLLRGRDEGGRRRRALQEGREPEALREYRRGDDPRLVAWKASARRGQLIVRKMRPEARQDLLVIIDAGRHLSGAHASEDGGEPRIEVAVTAGLVLAAAGLARGDRVGLLAVAGDVVAFERPGGGPGHLRRLARALAGVDARPEESDYGETVRFLLARQKRRAMIVFVTDVLDEPSARTLAAAVARLRGHHLPVVISLGDPALTRLARGAVNPASVAASERLLAQAAARLLIHRKQGMAALEAAGAVVVDAPAPRAAALAVETWATLKAQGRL